MHQRKRSISTKKSQNQQTSVLVPSQLLQPFDHQAKTQVLSRQLNQEQRQRIEEKWREEAELQNLTLQMEQRKDTNNSFQTVQGRLHTAKTLSFDSGQKPSPRTANIQQRYKVIPEYKQNPEVKQHSFNESVYKNAWERTELLLQARVKRPRGQVSLFAGSYEQHRAKVQATQEIERTRPISEKFTSLQIWQAQLRIPSKRLLKHRIQGLQHEHSVTNQPSSRNLYTKSDIHLTD